jgi:hypothetical protein
MTVNLGIDPGLQHAAGDGAAAPAATATTPTVRSQDQSRGSARLALVCVVLTIVPIVVATVRAVAGDWVAVGDNAYFLIRARDVFTEHHPLLGTWTSASLSLGIPINNPGPLLFDVLALPVKLAGDGGLAVGVALINVVSIIGIALVARRRAGPRGVVAAMAAASGLCWAMGSELLFDPWQPHSLLLPFLCFLVMVWALAGGDLGVLPWAVGVASFIVQTHVGYALLVPSLGAWGVGAAGVRLWRARRHDVAAWASQRRHAGRQVAAALAVGILCWSQSLFEQLFGHDGSGNLRRLAFGITAEQNEIGLSRAPRYVAEIVSLPPWWGRPSSRESFAAYSVLPSLSQSTASLPSLGWSIAGLAVVAAVLVAAAMVSRWRADGPGVWAAATGLALLGIAMAAASTTPVGIAGVAPHHFRWLWPAAVFVTFAVALPLVTVPGRGRVARAGLMVTALAAVTLTVFDLPTMNPTVGPNASADSMPTVRALLPQLSVLRGEPGVLFDMRGLRFAEPYSGPVMAELQRLGVPWFVDDLGMTRQVGHSRAYKGGGSVRLFLREGNGAREIPPGAHRVAFVEGLTVAEATELSALEDELTPFISDGGLDLDRSASEAQSGSVAIPSGQLDDPDYLFSSRALVGLVARDLVLVPDRWSGRLDRYAELQGQADFETVAVFAEPLGGL